jgi:hypothetical protein
LGGLDTAPQVPAHPRLDRLARIAGLAVVVLLVLVAVSTGTVPRKPLLIYYANETSERAARSENYAALTALLKGSASPLAARIAASIAEDAQAFPLVVQQDVEHILAAATRLRFDVAVFTNALALDHEYLLYRGRSASLETRRLPEPGPAPSAILATSPLSRPDVFRAALRDVSALYPADSLDAVLITRSHGSAGMALMPRVNVDLSRPDAVRALPQLLASGGGAAPPDWAGAQGTSKVEFWRMVGEVSAARGVRFPLVFRQACASGVSGWAEFFAVPASVAAVAHTGMRDVGKHDVDYGALFGARLQGPDWIGGVSSRLGDHPIVQVDTTRTLWLGAAMATLRSIPLAVFFVPLVAWLTWYFARRWRSAPGRGTG